LSRAAPALLQAPPQQPEDEGSSAEDDNNASFNFEGFEDVEVPGLRPFHRTRSSTVAQATVTAAIKTLFSSPMKWFRKKATSK
jgi:hypothetical protein